MGEVDNYKSPRTDRQTLSESLCDNTSVSVSSEALQSSRSVLVEYMQEKGHLRVVGTLQYVFLNSVLEYCSKKCLKNGEHEEG